MTSSRYFAPEFGPPARPPLCCAKCKTPYGCGNGYCRGCHQKPAQPFSDNGGGHVATAALAGTTELRFESPGGGRTEEDER